MRTPRLIPLLACALLLAALVPAVASGGGPKGATYAGETTGAMAVVLKMSADGQRIARLRINYVSRCSNGGETSTYTELRGVRVRERGRFSARGEYRGSGDGSRNRYSVSGTVGRRSAKGSFTLTAVSADGDTTCRSGLLDFRAARR